MLLGENAAFYPAFAAIGGIGTSFFSTQRSFRHGPIHTQPVPVDPTPFIFRFPCSLVIDPLVLRVQLQASPLGARKTSGALTGRARWGVSVNQ
jgi:hypothetical protein